MSLNIPIIKTKLATPTLRSDLIDRPRLTSRLEHGLPAADEQGFSRRLTLVSAPAGYGKTTLLRSWTAEKNCTTAWLTLDEAENEPVRFWVYFIASLANKNSGVGKLSRPVLASSTFSAGESTGNGLGLDLEECLVHLINELAEIKTPLLLVLDDYHLINEQQIHRGLAFLIENLPSTFHLVIATRSDPSLPLTLWRSRGWMSELRQKDLRFSSSEAAELLSKEYFYPGISQEKVNALTERTEGWVTGLQVAAMSLTGKEPVEKDKLLDGYIGSSRYILEYLSEEILEHQPPHIKDFLIKTAILETLTPSLCRALTGRDDSEKILEELFNNNLFISPLDNVSKSYRYHALFKELLLNILYGDQGDEVAGLHKKAGRWLMANGFAASAIDHALKSKDYLWATSLLEVHGEALFNQGEQKNLFKWLQEIPLNLLKKHPRLRILQSMLLYMSGELARSKDALEDVEGFLFNAAMGDENTKIAADTPEGRELAGMYFAQRAFLHLFSGEYSTITENAERALELLPENKPLWRTAVAVITGDVYAMNAKLNSAAKAYMQALSAFPRSEGQFFALMAGFKLARVYFYQGRFNEVENLCKELLHEAESKGFAQTARAGCLWVLWGMLDLERNQLARALDYAQKGLSIIEKEKSMLVSGWAQAGLARIHLARGELDSAAEALRRAEACGSGRSLAYVENLAVAYKARLWLAYGRTDPIRVKEAYTLMHSRNLPLDEKNGGLQFFRLDEYLSLVRVLIACKKGEEAGIILEQLEKIARANDIIYLLMETLLLKALSRLSNEENRGAPEAEALELIQQAFTEAGPRARQEGFKRVFIDEGPPLANLLYKAAAAGIYPEYISSLLLEFPDAPGRLQEYSPEQEPLIEPLSERELEILQLVASGRSNQDIADRLYLSLNTVKWHLRNIFGKLGVENRAAAAARARALKLLDERDMID